MFESVDVALIQWPTDDARRAEAAARSELRLLLVEPEALPPVCTDALEDWVRLPASPHDMKARVENLIARNDITAADVVLDEDGAVHHRSVRTRLTPRQARLLRRLLDSRGAVVSREELKAAGWPVEAPTTNTLEVNMVRLRRRISPLGLPIRTVRSRGYLLEEVEPGI